MTTDIVIRAQGLGKRYVLGTSRRHVDSFRDLIVQSARAMFKRRQKTAAEAKLFWALKDVGFAIRRGENVGIIGLNGAGKSTLLKVLSRIVTPTTGNVKIEGRVGALLEVGTGFHQELTGRENTYLYGAILGMAKEEIARKFDDIVEFSGIRQFIDTPVKRYSSGMYVRLAFAVAAHLEPEILLLDEVLSVGDLPFQRKCMEFAKQLQERNATILFVSHNMFSIKNMCERVIYLKQGQIAFDGPTDAGIARYEEECKLSTWRGKDQDPADYPITLTAIDLTDVDGKAKTVFAFGESMRIRMTFRMEHPVSCPNFIVVFVRSDGVICCNFSSEMDGHRIDAVDGIITVEMRTPPLKLVAERYAINVWVRKKGFQEILCAQTGSMFHVSDEILDTHFGIFHESAEWKLPVSVSECVGT